MEDITDADYMHAERVCKDFGIKNLGEYHDLYLKSNTLLQADVFKNLRKMCLKIYLDPVKYLSAPGLVWQAALKKIEVKLELFTDINMLFIVEKGIRGGICLETLHELLNDLPVLPERINIEKVEKLVTNLHDKTEYIIHIRNLK